MLRCTRQSSIGSPNEPVEIIGVVKSLALILRWRDSLQLQLCFGSTLDNCVSLDFPPFNGCQLLGAICYNCDQQREIAAIVCAAGYRQLICRRAKWRRIGNGRQCEYPCISARLCNTNHARNIVHSYCFRGYHTAHWTKE